MECANCGKDFFQVENEKYCKPCRVSYGVYLRAGMPNGFASRKSLRDRYSEKLRDGFSMIEGTFRG
jgi:hypothetical protein